jgi:hypothetical protein
MTDSLSRIEALYEQVLARTAEPRNQAKKDQPFPKFISYLENLGWVQLWGFDINRSYEDADYATEIQFRIKLYHLDKFDDDQYIDANLGAGVGMYWDLPLIGVSVRHQADGVPIFSEDHPIRKTPDLRLMKPHDFLTGGEMPKLLRFYNRMLEIARGRFNVSFPTWCRGPLDMAIALRGYEQFVEDTVERPQFVHGLMQYLIDERMRWWDSYLRHFNLTDRGAMIADDWINIPFISPAMFEEFCMPYYLQLEKYHGKISSVHSCGNKVPVQKMMLAIKSCTDHEVNHWTDLDATLANIPPDKFLHVNLLNTEVLLASPATMESDLRRITEKCAGRRYQVVATAIEKVHEDMAEDIAQVQRWIAIAKKVFGRDRVRS